MPKSTKMTPKSVHEALGEGVGSILGGLWEGLGANLAPRWFQGPKSKSFDPLLAAILEAKIDQKSILELSQRWYFFCIFIDRFLTPFGANMRASWANLRPTWSHSKHTASNLKNIKKPMVLDRFGREISILVPVTRLPPPSVGLPGRSPWAWIFCIFAIWPLLAPSWHHLGSNMAQDSHKMSQDSPKMLQDSPKMPPKSTKNRPKID